MAGTCSYIGSDFGTTKACVCGGAGALILLSTQAVKLIQDWLRITMGHTKGSNWWYSCGVMCACDHEVLIRYQSNTAPHQCMMPPHLRRGAGSGITVQHGSPEGTHSPIGCPIGI